MLYMLLICYDPSLRYEGPMLQPEHAKLEGELRERGIYLSGAGLMPVEATGDVRVRDGRVLRTDGPFAETKEVLGGYYIVECKDDAEAAEIAGRIPVEKRSWVQVQQIALYHPNLERTAAVAGS